MESIKRKTRRTSDRVTLKEIARHCNVSTATVSRVLNNRLNEFPVSDEMIQRVKDAAQQLDYHPNRLARAIRNQQTHLIGLSDIHITNILRTPDRRFHENQVMGEFVNLIIDHPKFEDYDLVIHGRKELTGQPLRPSDFKPDLLDGLIYLNPTLDHQEFLEVASKNFPIVLVGHIPGAEEKIACVDINNRKMGKKAVEHLIGLGRRNILMLTSEKLNHLCCIQDRAQGYRDALAENGMEISESLVHSVLCQPDQVALFFENLPCMGKVDAIFCADDDLAVLCFEPLKAMGYRIPEDIAIMGFENSRISQHTDPPLSTVYRPADRQIHAAIDLLLKILKKEIPNEPGFHEIEAELVIRESTLGRPVAD